MKRLIFLIIAILILIPGIAKAELALKSGIGFSLVDSKVNFLSTVELLKWKGLAIEAGYAGDSEKTQDKMIAAVSYSLIKLSDYVELPVLDLIECNVGLYAGIGRLFGSDEFDYGASATLLKIKF